MELVKDYITIGAGGVSFLVIISLFYFVVKNLYPLMSDFSNVLEANTKAIDNMGRAIDEVGKSNENVANALHLLKESTKTSNKLLEKHDNRAERIEIEVAKLSERTIKGG